MNLKFQASILKFHFYILYKLIEFKLYILVHIHVPLLDILKDNDNRFFFFVNNLIHTMIKDVYNTNYQY